MAGNNKGAILRQKRARDRANKLEPTLRKLIDKGLSQREICEALNRKGVKTTKGGGWYVSSLANILRRLGLKTKNTKRGV